VIPFRLPLQDFADPASHCLETREQAGRAVAAIAAIAIGNDPRRWVELDFSGIAGISPEFAEEFLRLADAAGTDIWLVPSHYGSPSTALIIALKDRLQRLRDKEWDRACGRCCGLKAGS
jgi:hypothetical protein